MIDSASEIVFYSVVDQFGGRMHLHFFHDPRSITIDIVNAKNHVFPIDDRRSERFNAAIAGRPDLIGERTSLTVYPGMLGITENAFINTKNRTYTITAPVELKDSNTNGVIIAQAGAFGGWTLYLKGGKVHHEYNYFGIERTNISGTSALTAGKHVIKYEFIADSPKPGTGGKCALYVDDQKVAEGHPSH